MKLIDSHCHIYLEEFEHDRDEMLKRAMDIGVERFYLPGIDSTVIPSMMALEEKYPSHCFAMMGLHPCYVKDNYKLELAIVKEWLTKRTFAAIGEIGLDYYWDTDHKKEQILSFEQQMQWALDYHLPIVIHTRNAMQETIECVKPFADKGLRGIFHCFSGSYESALQIVNMGFLLGIGGVLTYKNAGLGAVLEKIDVSHVVLETDAPYLTPVPFRGKRNEPAYLTYIIQKLAEIKGLSEAEIAAITSENALKIFPKPITNP
jgi:TatD DNase family protein